MTDTTNPQARLDAALAVMRRAHDFPAPVENITAAATVVCAEALSLLVDAHLPTPDPEPEPPEPDLRESLPDDTPVGHRWVMGRNGQELFRQRGNGYFTWWFRGARKWGAPGGWSQSGLGGTRPATVGDLRRVELPVTEWPDITAPEPEASCAEKAEAELRARELHHFEAEQSEAKAIAERDNAIAALRAVRDRLELCAALLNQSDDVRETYRKSWMLLEAGARSHGINLNEGVS